MKVSSPTAELGAAEVVDALWMIDLRVGVTCDDCPLLDRDGDDHGLFASMPRGPFLFAPTCVDDGGPIAL